MVTNWLPNLLARHPATRHAGSQARRRAHSSFGQDSAGSRCPGELVGDAGRCNTTANSLSPQNTLASGTLSFTLKHVEVNPRPRQFHGVLTVGPALIPTRFNAACSALCLELGRVLPVHATWSSLNRPGK